MLFFSCQQSEVILLYLLFPLTHQISCKTQGQAEEMYRRMKLSHDKELSCRLMIYELLCVYVYIIFNLKHFRKQASKWTVGAGIFTIFTKHSRKNHFTLLQFLSRNRKTSKHSPAQFETCITLIPKLNNDSMRTV